MAEIQEKDIVSVTEGDETFQGVVVKVKEVNCDIKFDGKDDPESHRIENVTFISRDTPTDKDSKLSDVGQLAANLADERKSLKLERADFIEQQKELKQRQDRVAAGIGKSITISDTDVDMGKFNKIDDPKAYAIEVTRQKENSEKRHTNRIKKAQAAAGMTPVLIRENLLRARLNKVRMRHHHTYKKEQIDLWAQELTFIIQTPDVWRKGCVKAKKQLGAMDRLDKLFGDD